MAFSSSSSSSSDALKKHDVFISFRGEDTRANFTSFLHAALCRSYIETYIDYSIEKGDKVWVELEKAIKESTLFLVVFSENYASSTWCLNELVEIMECNKNGEDDVVVIPVFYRIEPSHVRKQTGSYHTGLAKHKKEGKDKIQKWKNVLFEASNLSGFDCSTYRTESDLIEDIVKVVLQKLNHKYTNELRCLFLPDENYSSIESSLKIDSREVRIIGIWGMGGIGKTTLAAAIFQKVSSQYEGSCFLENVTEESRRHGLSYTCNRLLSKLLREDLGIDTPKVIPSMVMRRLKRMKAFIVLDDVHTSDLLKNLIVGHACLGAGSRVIVTTRDKHVLISGGVDDIHQVKEMNFQNSRRLFSLNAFNKILPIEGYEEISNKAVGYAKGNPLALKVLGSFLCSKSKKEWNSALTKLKEIPNAEIQKVLRLSYDDLDRAEKNIFLDIACFFKGCGRSKVTKILNACGFFADIGIRNLLDKALIYITSYNRIRMHDLIQEMGREIVREESIKNPGRRSRLWNPEEIYDVLTNNMGTNAVEGIWLDMDQITCMNLRSEAFKTMPNLRLLAFEALNRDVKRINSVHLPRGLEFLPKNLRGFGWSAYPLNSLPSTFCPQKLVELCLPYSNVEKLWDGEQNLPSLERIDLSESARLMECPNLSRAPNLKHVILGKCESLPHVDPSIFNLPKLVELDVSGCKSLKSLCSNTCSQSLQRFYAWGCLNLHEFSSIPPNTSNPSTSNPSTSDIKNLEIFSFPISESLMDLPENFAYQITLSDSMTTEHDTLITLHKVLPSPCFRFVRRLFFMLCHTLSEIPDSISLLSSLEYLGLFFSPIINLSESIKSLPRLILLEVGECKMLKSIPALPQSLQCFFVWNCESLQNVLTSTSETSKKHKCTFLLPNCIKLDQHSYDAILKDAIVRIELGAKPLPAEVLENKEEASSANDDDDDDYYNDLYNDLYIFEAVRSGKICYMLPAANCKFGDWFHYHSTQVSIAIELPPRDHLGFIFYLVLSQIQPYHIGYRGSFGCECYLETTWGEWISIKSFFVDESVVLNPHTSFDIKSDHVFLWYDAQCCEQIMEAIKEIKANDMSTIHNSKLTFKFFARTQDNMEATLKECGFRWIYTSEDQIVEEGEGCESERCRETHRVEGSESDEHEEMVPPANKFQQSAYGTLFNLEAGETKDLSGMLEELLHIGFGGDLM